MVCSTRVEHTADLHNIKTVPLLKKSHISGFLSFCPPSDALFGKDVLQSESACGKPATVSGCTVSGFDASDDAQPKVRGGSNHVTAT